jgi:hypothetical protein
MMPRTPSPGGGDGLHGNSGASEDGGGGANDSLEEARVQEGAAVGHTVGPQSQPGDNNGGGVRGGGEMMEGEEGGGRPLPPKQ